MDQQPRRWKVIPVPDDAPNPDGLLARRLDHLFRTAHPAARKAYTPAEVAVAINAAASERVTSGTYLWQLRTGRRDNPTYKVVVGLADFFGVSPTYFFEDAAVERGAVPHEVVVALQDDAVREIALRAAGLSEESLKVIAETVALARERDEARGRRSRSPRRTIAGRPARS
jgi:transcriptional regulator with XRE-family HTH domain